MTLSYTLLALLIMSSYTTPLSTESLDFDFGNTSKKMRDWGSINDGVMGGRSIGRTSYSDNSLVFEGSISFDNNGGFASVRCPYQDFDLSKYKLVRVRYRAIGQTFALSLNTSRRFYMPNYRVYLAPSEVENEWVELVIPLVAFKQHRMGNPTGYGISREALDSVIQMTFISADKKEGSFRLEIDFLRFESGD